jgi:lipooligosaccharide transport system permease protein
VAYTATLRAADSFNILFRFGITPLFLFSGVFFPVTRLPESLQWVAWFTPLFHGVELVRALTLDAVTSPVWVLHVAYLSGLTAGGTLVAVWTFSRALRA